METRTLRQKPPSPTPQVSITATNGTVVETSCSPRACLNLSQKIGTGFAIVLAGLALVAAIWWYIFWMKRAKYLRARVNKTSGKQERDIEEGADHDGGGGQKARREARVLFGMMDEEPRPNTPQRYMVLGNQVIAVGPPAVRPPTRDTPRSPTPGQHPRSTELTDSAASSRASSENKDMMDVENMIATSVSTSTNPKSSSMDEDDKRTLPMIQVTAPTPEKKRQQDHGHDRNISDSPTQIRRDLLMPSSATKPRASRRAARRKANKAAPKLSIPSKGVKQLVIKDDKGLVFALDECEDMHNPRVRRPESIIARVTTKASRRRLAEKERQNREEREFELMERRRNDERTQRRDDRQGRGRRQVTIL